MDLCVVMSGQKALHFAFQTVGREEDTEGRLMVSHSTWPLPAHHPNPSRQLQTFHLAATIDALNTFPASTFSKEGLMRFADQLKYHHDPAPSFSPSDGLLTA